MDKQQQQEQLDENQIQTTLLSEKTITTATINGIDKKQRPNVMITTYSSSKRRHKQKLQTNQNFYCDRQFLTRNEETETRSSIKIDRDNLIINDKISNNNKQVEEREREEEEEEEEVDEGEGENTKSEKSTDLFNNIKRNALNQFHYYHLNGNKNNSNRSKKQLNNRVPILLDLNQIKGPNGSVRGHKDVVRKSLENIKVVQNSVQQQTRRNFTLSSMPSFASSTSTSEIKHLTTTTTTTTTNYSSNENTKTNSTNQNENMKNIDFNLERKLYLEKLIEDENDLCVAYTTTLGIIRRTFEDSKLMKSILNLNLIKYEERDIYLNQEYKEQLKIRCQSMRVPVLFVMGKEIGGIKELELLNENGKLSSLLAKFKMETISKELCQCCGNVRFIACQNCNGSRKSTIHHFKFNSIALRCTKCDKNDGIIQCPVCSTSNCNSNNSNNNNNNNNSNNKYSNVYNNKK